MILAIIRVAVYKKPYFVFNLHVLLTLIHLGIPTVSPFNDTIIGEGDTTAITCEALGYPPPTVEWNRIDGFLSYRVSLNDSVSVLTGNGNVTRVSVNLTITNAYREDSGVYACSASNSIGSDDRIISITIQCKFMFRQKRNLKSSKYSIMPNKNSLWL